MNPIIHATAIAALEQVINQGLKLGSDSAQTLEQLEGRIFWLDIEGTELNLYLLPGRHGLQLRGFLEGPVDTHVRGTIADFVELIGSTDTPSTLINGGISIRGDSAPLLQLIALLQTLSLDWEASLAGLIGDIPAHQVGRIVRNGLRWGKHAAGSLGRQVEEFLHEEARLLPTHAELQDF